MKVNKAGTFTYDPDTRRIGLENWDFDCEGAQFASNEDMYREGVKTALKYMLANTDGASIRFHTTNAIIELQTNKGAS